MSVSYRWGNRGTERGQQLWLAAPGRTASGGGWGQWSGSQGSRASCGVQQPSSPTECPRRPLRASGQPAAYVACLRGQQMGTMTQPGLLPSGDPETWTAPTTGCQKFQELSRKVAEAGLRSSVSPARAPHKHLPGHPHPQCPAQKGSPQMCPGKPGKPLDTVHLP